jgi:hypothetical protein
MNKFKKIGLTALAASLVSVSANAEVAVTGTATLSFAGGGDHVTGNGWSMNDHLAFAWGGELDNGFTVDMAFRLDNGDNGTNSRLFDNRSMAIGMGDAGTLTFYGSAGDSVISAKDMLCQQHMKNLLLVLMAQEEALHLESTHLCIQTL